MSILKEYYPFIIGIYGERIFDFFCTLMQKREVQQFIFFTVLFFAVHMLLNRTPRK